MRILFIHAEDNQDNALHWMRPHLAGLDCRVDVAVGRDHALALCQEQTHVLALVEVNVPDGDGIGLIGLLRQSHPEMPVVGIARNSSRELELAARREGVIFYLIRPADDRYLETIVRYLADQQTRTKEKVS